MDFTDQELRELAAFLARRLTPDLQPTLTTDAPPSAFDDWERVLSEARRTGRLPGLLRDAARILPKDPYLREACALVDPPPRVGSLLAGGLAAVAAAGLVLLSLVGFATAGVLAAVEAAGPRTLVLAEIRNGSLGGVALGDRGGEALGAAQVHEEHPGEERPSEPSLEQAPALASGARPCQVDGWIYAGLERPSEPYSVPYAVHVRSEPPSKANGWNSRTPTRCWLRKGDVVQLAEPALELPGGHWWVHVSPPEYPELALVDTRR